MKQVLFSCLGTTDPVRGEHDGPMLHILRHYRPESVFLVLTPEIREFDRKDARFEKTRDWIAAHWGGYCPEFRFHDIDVRDAHDMDALDRPLHDAMAELSAAHPDAEILVNVTSGTPQMQVILSQMAMDMRYRARGVQVNNFERRAGTSQRTNHREYDVELELECNEDETPDAENRCVEPKLYAMSREYSRRQIGLLLDARDFEAVDKLKDRLPEELGIFASHLAERSRLHDAEAKRLAGALKGLPFPLYPYKTGSRGEYNQVVEYYLLMKNRARTGNFTEFVLHLEPLTLTLQKAALDKLLQSRGHSRSEFAEIVRRRETFYPDRLRTAYPELYRHYERSVREVREAEVNTYLLDGLLSFFPELPDTAKRLFEHYALLKNLRNDLAHSLYAVAEEDVKAECGADAGTLLREIEGTIHWCYPACDPKIFSVYEKSVAYIKGKL